MSKIHAVILVPAAGDPHNLLKRGPCGARPPTAWKPPNRPWCEGGYSGSGDPARALVLAWDGERVNVAKGWLPPMGQGLIGAAGSLISGNPYAKSALFGTAEFWSFGTIILLDVDGNRVTP